MVWDLTDDVPVYQFRERLHLRPASTMKCVTSIATLDKLGADYDFKTRLYYTGEIDDSTKCCVATSIALAVWIQCSPHQT